MIECLVCKKYHGESDFVELRYGGLAICYRCIKTEEAKKLKEASLKNLEENSKRQDAYEEDREEKIRNQIYDGQYDWM